MENATATGIDAVVNALTTQLSGANLWGVVGSVVPVLAIGVLFGLGFGLIKKIVNKIKSRKGGM